MATEPKRPDERDNIVSLREARARQEAQARSAKARPGSNAPGTKKMPVLLIFLSLLAMLVAFKFLSG